MVQYHSANHHLATFTAALSLHLVKRTLVVGWEEATTFRCYCVLYSYRSKKGEIYYQIAARFNKLTIIF